MKVAALLFLCLVLASPALAASPKHLGDELLVQFHDYVPVVVIQGIITKLGTKSDGVMFVGRERIYLIKITNGRSAEDVAAEFKKISEVKSVSLNYVRNPN